MASKSRPRPQRKKTTPNEFANLNLFEIPNLDLQDIDDGDDDSGNEEDLESELMALMSGEQPVRRKKLKNVAPPMDIEQMAAACLKDDDEDVDVSSGEEEDLLKELQKLSPGSPEPCEESASDPPEEKTSRPPPQESTDNVFQTLQSRLNLYKEAIKVAKENNDKSRIRRYDRALKTLESMIKSHKSGVLIDEEEIPPVVTIPKSSNAEQRTTAPVISSKGTEESDAKANSQNSGDTIPNVSIKDSVPNDSSAKLVNFLTERREQYKVAALKAKKAGDKEMAINCMRTAKSFNPVIEAANNNQPVDLSNIPPPPPCITESNPQSIESGSQKVEHEQVQTASAMEIAALAAANDEEQPKLFDAPPPPCSVLEALQQRLEKYRSTQQAAEAEGNGGKARRLNRIVKSYEQAIKDYKANKEVNFDELPTPPGFAPIPHGGNANSQNNANTSVKPALPARPAPTKPAPAKEANVPQPIVKKQKLQRGDTTTGKKQLEFLLERQKLFRQAALDAKKSGHIKQATEYLRMSKGFDSMIEAVKCGLPIDTSKIPTPPQLETDFEIVDVSDCEEVSDMDNQDLLQNLEKDLCNQIEICIRNKNHFLRLGDVSSASKFERLAMESKKDLSVIQHLKNKGQDAPKFHYEYRLFSMVMCNPDLSDSELEVKIERGINLPGGRKTSSFLSCLGKGKPDDLDSYIKVEFPIPSETPQRAKTHTIRDTNNPVFEESFKFEINRKSKSVLRLFKRKNLTLECWSKGGFLRSDTLLGTCSIKLIDLEAKCSLHESYDLLNGRKPTGGKLEVKVCVREPLLVKQVEEVKEKWLVIGN